MSGADRGKYLFRIARILQERAREFAVLETLDNGKPIKESRDVDIPLAAAHFFYHAGWADKLEYAGLLGRRRPAADRRRRPGHPVELPAAHARVEDRAGAGLRQHRRPQAGRDHAADRAALRRGLPAGRPAAGRRQHRHRRRRHRPGPRRAPRRRQDRLHRLDRGRQGDRPHHRRHPQEAPPSSSAARRPTSSSTTPRIDQAVEGIVNGIFFNQGHVCCAGSPAARAGVRRTTRSIGKLKRRLATLRVGDPLDKNTDLGAINSEAQLDRIRELRASARPRAPSAGAPRATLPSQGLLVPPDDVHRCRRPTGSPRRRSSGRSCRC